MSSEEFLTHLEIIRRLARGDIDGAGHALRELSDCGWGEFVEFLKEQRLREYFLSALGDARLASVTPTSIRDQLTHYGKWSGKKSQQLAELQADAQAAFQARGIGCLVLKGEALTHRFHPAGFARHQGDVDLLVREADVPEAVAALQSIGAQLRKGKQSLSAGRLEQEHAAALNRGKHAVDLHWMLRPGPGYAISMERVWRDRRPLVSASGVSETVCDEDLLVLLCVSLASDLGRGGVRLKSLLDVFYVLQRLSALVRTEEFWQRRQVEGIERVCRHVLAVVNEIFPPIDAIFVATDSPALNATREAALRLITQPRNAVENFLWLARIHRLWQPRSAWWWLCKSVQRPSRFPNALGRWAKHSLRFLAWTVTPRKRSPVAAQSMQRSSQRRAA